MLRGVLNVTDLFILRSEKVHFAMPRFPPRNMPCHMLLGVHREAMDEVWFSQTENNGPYFTINFRSSIYTLTLAFEYNGNKAYIVTNGNWRQI